MHVEQMSSGEMERFLKSRTSGVLAACLGEIPYCAPMAYGYDGESVYFIITKTGRLLSYLTTGNNVACFTVFEAGPGADNYISVILEGSVSKAEGHEITHASSVLERQLKKPKGSLNMIAAMSKDDSRLGIYKLAIRTRSGRKRTEGLF
jgi:nitroimidazol reductase NimA-like FMN-containing flavoprotein (pyridoxamine 5'-phosphate oxidase superfamily)